MASQTELIAVSLAPVSGNSDTGLVVTIAVIVMFIFIVISTIIRFTRK